MLDFVYRAQIDAIPDTKMPAPITVIIPTLNSVAQLGPTLTCVFEGVESGLVHQVILADGGSTDNIADVAQDSGALLTITRPGRGIQLCKAAKCAQTDWLLFLHADTTLSQNWEQVVKIHLETSTKAAHFKLHFDAAGLAPCIVAAWANLRSHVFALPYGDQGLLISRVDYNNIGGYPQIPLMEDVAIVCKLRGKLITLPAIATTSAAKYRRAGWLRQGTKNLITLIRYAFGTSPEKLVKFYEKR